MRNLYFTVFILLIWAPAYGAKVLHLQGEFGGIHVPVVKGWTLEKNVLGLPYVYFSEHVNGQKSNMSLINSKSKIQLDEKSLKKDEASYLEGKKNWAKKVNAKIIKAKPYETFINAHGHKVHQIGVQYLFKKKLYSENSYYVECRDKTLILKSLNLVKNFKHQVSFNRIAKEINCD